MKLDTLNKIHNATVYKEPFDHFVIDDFFDIETADKLEKEFPQFNDPLWYSYNNQIEVKKAMNSWDKFPPTTYQTFWDLCSTTTCAALSSVFGGPLFADIGLNGGGWHIHGRGGALNVHQDYSIHPKIPLQRKVNIIIHLSKNWDTSWGGGLELWSHDQENFKPKELIKTVDIKYNRAVFFDTTQNSWHGFSKEMTQPEGVYRKTLAIYYVQNPDASAQNRNKALFSPRKEQEGDQEVLDLIKRRANLT